MNEINQRSPTNSPQVCLKPVLLFFWKLAQWCLVRMVTYYFYISRQTHYMAKFFFSRYGPKCYRSVKLSDSLKCNMSRKNSGIKLIICVDIKVKVFFEMCVFFCLFVCLFVFCLFFLFFFFLMDVAIYAQITQNIKCAIHLLHYLKKKVRDKFDFLHEDIHQSFLHKLIWSFLMLITRYGQSTQN